MDLILFLRVLLKKKWTILFAAFFAVLVAFVYKLFEDDLYESAAQYSTGFTSEKVRLTDGSSAVDLYTVEIKFNNTIETFKSLRVLSILSYKLMIHDLENPTEPFTKLTKSQRESKEFKQINSDTVLYILNSKLRSGKILNSSQPTEQKIEKLLELYNYDISHLRKNLIVRRVERTDYIDIAYQSHNPELSAYLVNTLGAEFLNYYKNLNAQRNVESAKNIEQLMNRQQLVVDSLTNKLKFARITQGALDPLERTKSAMETEKELRVQLAQSQSEFNLHSQLYNTYNERLKVMNASASGNSGSSDAISLIRKRDQLIEQNSNLSSPDPEISRQIQDLNSQINQRGAGNVGRVKSIADLTDLRGKMEEEKAYMEAAEASIRQLMSAINTSKNIGNANPSSIVEIQAIERQVEIENNELKSIREKLSQAQGLVQDDPTTNFRQTVIGQPDIEPIPKKRIFTMGLAGMSMVLLSSLFFIFKEIFDNSIKTPSQFNKLINLRVKGVVNTVSLAKSTISDIMTSNDIGAEQTSEFQFKNSVRKLRYEIEKTGKKVFLFCSTQKGTGKTTIISAIAHALILTGKKVLIIDLNFDHPSLTLNYKSKNFVEDLKFRDVNRFEVNSNDLISYTTTKGLSIIGCKGGNYSPAEILSNEALRQLISDCKSKFDFVLIESACLNERSDTNELFQHVESVISIFSSAMIPSQTDAKSVESLKSLDDKNFGAIINAVPVDHMDL